MDGDLERCDPRAAFHEPLWWGALAVLVANDHALKGSGLVPGALTGKLSDFAGLAFWESPAGGRSQPVPC